MPMHVSVMPTGRFVMPRRVFVMPASRCVMRWKEIVMPRFDMITHAVADSAKLATLRDDLPPRLLSGRVRVGSRDQPDFQVRVETP